MVETPSVNDCQAVIHQYKVSMDMLSEPDHSRLSIVQRVNPELLSIRRVTETESHATTYRWQRGQKPFALLYDFPPNRGVV